MRNDGWRGLGTCSAYYEGTDGWVETGDSGRMEASPNLRSELKYFGMPGTSPDNHIREFLDCVKSRKNPASNANVAANAHIASHCAKIAWDLNRKVVFDPVKEEFLNDDEANKLRSRAMRAPWRC